MSPDVLKTLMGPARDAVVSAQREARNMGREAIGVEHLLLGLFSDENTTVGRVLADFGLTFESVRDVAGQRLGVGREFPAEGQLPFSPAAQDALRSAHRFGMGAPGTEHILIVLVAHGEGPASEITRAFGVDPTRVRAETKKRAWPRSVAIPGQPGRGRVEGTTRPAFDELDFGD